MIKWSISAFAAVLLIALPSIAQTPQTPPIARVNATVEGLQGDKLTVKTAERGEQTVILPGDVRVMQSRQATIEDVKEGSFIGCTAIEEPDGKLDAEEIHVMSESLRGLGEGHYPWGDQPQVTMTNGTVERLEGVSAGHVIKVGYKGGETEIQVPPGSPVTLVEPASLDSVKPGVAILLGEATNPDGTIVAKYIGIKP